MTWVTRACGAALVALTGAGLTLHHAGEIEIEGVRGLWFIVLLLFCGGVYLVACGGLLRGAAPSMRWVLGVALAMRALAFVSPPNLSSDIYRYVWDGRVQRAGINPYLYIPADPALAALRDAAVFPNMNRAETARTIYAPAAQLLFRVVDAIRPGVWGMKAAILLLECVAIGALALLLRDAGRPPAFLLIYAWCPMPVWEYAGNGHIDGAALGFLGLAVLAAVRRRQGVAGAALAWATLCKFLPAAIAPALWDAPRWRAPAAFVITVAALYAIYADAGRAVFGFLGGYAAEEGFSSGRGIAWLGVWGTLPDWAGRAWLAAGTLVLAGLAIVMLRTPPPGENPARALVMTERSVLLASTATFIITPHYAWYLGWLVWFGGVTPRASLLWLGAAAPLTYLDARYRDVGYSLACYVPFVLLALRRRFFGAPHVRDPDAHTRGPDALL